MSYDLKTLDFDNIRKALQSYAKTPYGVDAIQNMEPAPTRQVAQQMQDSVSSARKRLDNQQDFQPGELPNIRAALRQASQKGTALNTQALHNIYQIIQGAESLLILIADDTQLYPQNMPAIVIPVETKNEINKAITESGRLKADASEKLCSLNTELQEKRQEAEKLIRNFIKEQKKQDCFAEGKPFQWYGDRAVVAVKTEKLDKVKGVIKGSQAGGKQQLVEPLVAMGVNNTLERISQNIYLEQQRILAMLTEQVGHAVPALSVIIDAITWVDIAFSAAHLSEQMNAHAPVLLDQPVVRLNQAYHPMLLIQFLQGKLDRPVPVSLKIETDKSFILITGPNTGGKTVVLKTLGLLQIMAQCGLHIPAEEDCEMGWFNTVMVDMGDKQSMYHQLSTFAGHVEVMKSILDNAKPGALFLLDELGTGTDPEEGAALAMAMIDSLISSGSMGIVNTHLSPLKPYAESHEKIQNATMMFDHEKLSPTYELVFGINGQSLGLTIAERNGLPVSITDQAKIYLSEIKNT